MRNLEATGPLGTTTVEGQAASAEREITGVAGYRGRVPVRVGNVAPKQHLLDAYWMGDRRDLESCRRSRKVRVDDARSRLSGVPKA